MDWKYFLSGEESELLELRQHSPNDLERFCNEEGFSDEQFLYLLKLHHELLSTCEEGVSVLESTQSFKQSFQHSMFTIDVVKKVIKFIFNGFFQHYSLYQNLFTNPQQLKEINHQINIEVVPSCHPFPNPLEEAVTKSMHSIYFQPPVEIQEDSELFEQNEAEEEQRQEESVAGDVLLNFRPSEIKDIVNNVLEKKLPQTEKELMKAVADTEANLMQTINKMSI